MREVISGYLGLYRFRTDKSYEFATRFLYKASNEGMEVPNITFKRAVANFLGECPSVQQDVKDKVYKNSNIDEMIAAFNACLNKKPQFVVEEKKEKKQKVKESKELQLIKSITENLSGENISEELATLLKDIKGKITNGDKVPSYLKSALQEATKEYSAVEKDVTELIALLK